MCGLVIIISPFGVFSSTYDWFMIFLCQYLADRCRWLQNFYFLWFWSKLPCLTLFLLVLNYKIFKEIAKGDWSGFGKVSSGMDPTCFGLYPTSIPPGVIVQKCHKYYVLFKDSQIFEVEEEEGSAKGGLTWTRVSPPGKDQLSGRWQVAKWSLLQTCDRLHLHLAQNDDR